MKYLTLLIVAFISSYFEISVCLQSKIISYCYFDHVCSINVKINSNLIEDSSTNDESDYREAKIIVQGQAFGGYFRAHARNEAYFMRKLSGALEEYSDRTEIIVEGKKKIH
mmetsp:Transcript_4791/g.7247  ORF Transcript_4791/g.7247 Transcript_4791/m.7247 type:complete len:111 (-) Transcript_4791:8-340(-)